VCATVLNTATLGLVTASPFIMQLYHKSEFSKVRITQIFYFRIQVIYKNEAGSIMKKFNHGDIEIETELEVSRDEFIHGNIVDWDRVRKCHCDII